MSEKSWIKAIKEEDLKLDKIPAEERTLAVCLAAMETGYANSWQFRLVPKAVREDASIWSLAFRNQYCGWGEVPDFAKTPELCAEALEEWPLNLRFVPDALKTPEMCAEAFARDVRAAVFVPEALRTEAMSQAVLDLQGAAAEALELSEEMPEGAHVKVQTVAFLSPGSRFPRMEDLPEEVRDQAFVVGPGFTVKGADAEDGDILVTEWGEPGGTPEWQYQILTHAVCKEEGDEFDPEDCTWDKGAGYAWNRIRSWQNTPERAEGFEEIRWRVVTCLDPDADRDDSGDAIKASMELMPGIWTKLKGVGWFPVKVGDIWSAFGRGLIDLSSTTYDDTSYMLRDALRWACPSMGEGRAEVLSRMACEHLRDSKTDLEAWFADELGRDAWQESKCCPDWIAEDTDDGGVCMVLREEDCRGTEREQLFADALEYGAIVRAIHYGDCDPESDGEEMNAGDYDAWAEWSIAGAVPGNFGTDIGSRYDDADKGKEDVVDCFGNDHDLLPCNNLNKIHKEKTMNIKEERAKQKKLMKKLEKAIDKENIGAIKKAVEAGANINGWFENRNLPLQDAFYRDNNVLKTLIDLGADVNARNIDGSMPLHTMTSVDAYETLLAAGADIHAIDENGGTVLHSAVRSDDADLVEIVLKAGGISDINARNYKGETPIFETQNADIINLLLDNGAEINIADNNGDTPLHNCADYYDATELLIDKGADVNAKNHNGETPLNNSKEPDVIELLVSRGADVKNKSNSGETALHNLGWNNQEKVVEALVKNGADVNAIDNSGDTPLHNTTDDGAIKALLKAGADVNAINYNGETPLFSVFREEKVKTTKLLLAAGADINIRNHDGETPLFSAVNNGNDKQVKLLLDAGADVNAVSNNGETALFQVANNETPKIAKILLEAGLDVNARDNHGETPLHNAAYYGHDKVVKFLIESGADVNAFSNYGETPLDKADNDRVEKMLIKAGAVRGDDDDAEEDDD